MWAPVAQEGMGLHSKVYLNENMIKMKCVCKRIATEFYLWVLGHCAVIHASRGILPCIHTMQIVKGATSN